MLLKFGETFFLGQGGRYFRNSMVAKITLNSHIHVHVLSKLMHKYFILYYNPGKMFVCIKTGEYIVE